MKLSDENLYDTYEAYKDYKTPKLSRKDIRRFDELIWGPSKIREDMNILEIGCGTGSFLSYLSYKKCCNFMGIDQDPALENIIPDEVRSRFFCRDVWEALSDPCIKDLDRIIALDVLEHFPPNEVIRLLMAIKEKLRSGGKITLKSPNASSPWGLQYQFGDLTHRAMLTPLSVRQLAAAVGMNVDAILPVVQGSRRRRFTDAVLHRFLSWALLTPPQIWSANFVAILSVP